MFSDSEFQYRGGELFCEDVSLASLAERYDTPAFVYSKTQLLQRFSVYKGALEGMASRACYAVKANSNLSILAALAQAGAGFDIVSGGELFRVLRAGAPASSVVFSGVGKTNEEIQFALEAGIHSFNCESEHEIQSISRLASALGKVASVALRVNPDVDATTHPYISTGLSAHKFGVAIAEAPAIYARAARLPAILVEGVSCHIGSQLLDTRPLLEAADKVIQLVGLLRSEGIVIRTVDLGGGVGVAYRPEESVPDVNTLIGQLRAKLAGLDVTLMLEPGRSIIAEAGILLTRVILTKRNGTKTFVIVDGAMNDLIRPSLYSAYHAIVPVLEHADRPTVPVDVVGPVCETGDFFARGRELPELRDGELVAIRNAGAYGFVLSSNYNSRPRSCELLISGAAVHVARERESQEDLIRGEHLPA